MQLTIPQIKAEMEKTLQMACSGGYKYFQVCWMGLFNESVSFLLCLCLNLKSINIFLLKILAAIIWSYMHLHLFSFLFGRQGSSRFWVGWRVGEHLVSYSPFSYLVLIFSFSSTMTFSRMCSFLAVMSLARRRTPIIKWFAPRHFITQICTRQTTTPSKW